MIEFSVVMRVSTSRIVASKVFNKFCRKNRNQRVSIFCTRCTILFFWVITIGDILACRNRIFNVRYYNGIGRHVGENRDGWETVLSGVDYNKMFTLQQESMEDPAPPDDLPAKPYFASGADDEPKSAPTKNPTPQPAKSIISFDGFTPARSSAATRGPTSARNTRTYGSKIHKPSNNYNLQPTASAPDSFTLRPVSMGINKAEFRPEQSACFLTEDTRFC